MISEVKKAALKKDEEAREQKYEQKKHKENGEAVDLITDEEAMSLAKDDATLERIILEIREDSEVSHDPNYKKIYSFLAQENLNNFIEVKKGISEEKASIVERVRKGQHKHSADISRKHSLKRNYNEVFGKNSTTISYEDYLTLLEMKKLLDVDEQIELSGFKNEWVFLKS